ncbi:type II toxin-antitoxin system PemK/MazF family toxin [Pedococcus bigeumensis]|uniref:type II toxin-antitoxin system PemK/MazF family toxin n=1 Tax=Pedococcus bigeumensis TaxID=433644 RepID=UPI002FEC6727
MGDATRTMVRQDGWLRRFVRWLTDAYPGDFVGLPEMEYSPVPDGRPDPGEVVWTWVPFEDDHRKGKDRPVLLIGRDGRWLLGVMLTTKLRVGTDERRRQPSGRVPVGVGAWDRQRRPSEARVDRIIRVKRSKIRREGAAIDAERFAAVAAGVRRNA